MKERPILFSAPMVRAILAGKKTQTRRIVKCPPKFVLDLFADGVVRAIHEDDFGDPEPLVYREIACPYGGPGDRLWVRETWYCDNITAPNWNPGKKIEATPELLAEWRESLYYRADATQTGTCCEVIPECACSEYRTASGQKRSPWRPGIHMPRWACRLSLEIAGVRVERLHAITGRDVLAEGVDNGKSNPAQGERWENMQRLAFQALWDSINGKSHPMLNDDDEPVLGDDEKPIMVAPKSWATNPWVWVVEFRRCT